MSLSRSLSLVALALVSILTFTGCEQIRLSVAKIAGLPTDDDVLFWTDSERDKAFRQMEVLTTTRTIEAGETPRAVEQGPALTLSLLPEVGADSIEQYMENQNTAGILILHKGQIRLQAYGNDYGPEGRWTSFSVAKSLTSTLVGAAIVDGYIGGLEDPLTQYIPQLTGSGYDGVSVRQLLTMQSGVRWNEDYTDPESDVAKFNLVTPEPGVDPIVSYMRTLPREYEPGTQWRYNTGETNLIGVLVSSATGKPLADYLSEKVWAPYGMQADAEWILNAGGTEIGGCCISARLLDYALFGQFAMQGGAIAGTSVVPEGWFDQAGSKQADIGRPGSGYGFQWWTYDDGSYAAQGIFGQGIFIDPARELVIASNSNWATATDPEMSKQRIGLYRSVQAAIDAESATQ